MFTVSLGAQPTKPGGPEGSLQWSHNGAFAGVNPPAGTGFGLTYSTGANPTDTITWACNGNPNVGTDFIMGNNSTANLIVGNARGVPAGQISSLSNSGLGINAPNGSIVFSSANNGLITIDVLGNFIVDKLGAGYQVKEGVNGMQGVAVLVAGTVTVNNVNVAANSRIFLTSQVDGGVPGFLRVSGRVNATSFTITSSNALDTSTVAYEIFAPADA